MPASATLTIDIEGRTPTQVEQMKSVIAGLEAQFDAEDALEADEAVLGWTVVRAGDLLQRLRDDRSGLQAKVLAEAATSVGEVSREKVYELGSFPMTRSLKGFTRPVNRIVKEMQAAGLLPQDAAIPMQPKYDRTVASFQRAQGFVLPAQLVEIFSAAAAAVPAT